MKQVFVRMILASFFLLGGCDQKSSTDTKISGCATERPSDASIVAALVKIDKEMGGGDEPVSLVGVAADCDSSGTRQVLYKEGGASALTAQLLRSDNGKWYVKSMSGEIAEVQY